MTTSNLSHEPDDATITPPPTASHPSTWWTRLRWPRWMPAVLGLVLLLLLGKLFMTSLAEVSEIFKPIFVPLLISVALAYLMNPLVDRLEARKLKRHWAVLATMTLATVGLCGLLLILIPIGVQLTQLTTKLPQAVRASAEWIQPRLKTLHDRFPQVYDKVSERVSACAADPTPYIEPITSEFGSVFANVLKVLGSVLNLILIPFFVYYILKDAEALRDSILRLIPPRHQKWAKTLTDQIDTVLSTYVRGQLVVCTCMGVLYTIAFWFLGVPLALAMGMLSGFGHLIPYVGTFSAAVLTLLLTLVNEPTGLQIALVIATYPVVQSTEGFVLTPLILGERLDLHPFLVIVGLLLAHHLFGILGIILAVPALAVAKVLLEFLHRFYLNSTFYRFSPDDEKGKSPPISLTTSEPVAESLR